MRTARIGSTRRSGGRTAAVTGLTVALATVATLVVAPTGGGAATQTATKPTAPSNEPFYRYTGRTPIAKVAPGTALRTRTVSYHLAGITVPITVTQVLYRTADALKRPTVNVTSVLAPPAGAAATHAKAVSYQSFYDSLNPADEPSFVFAGGTSFGGVAANAELAVFTSFLLAGYPVIVPDTQGQTADFAAGPEYGYTTLDSVRAVSHVAAARITRTARIGLIGYSGGAIATDWAAALAPSYAPDVNKRLVGAAEGGVLVDPAHNLHYIDGSLVWAGVAPMALVGIARGFHIDLKPYLSAYGLSVYAKLKNASIAQVLGAYPGLTFAQLAKPQYAKPESIPVYVKAANKLNLGSRPSPTVPMFIGQGANGTIEGTSGTTKGIGAGDGVMIAGDVRSLARKYCAAGTRVQYTQYDLTSHFTTVALWLPQATSWLLDRFGGGTAPQNCSSIAAGNSLAPIA